MATRPDESLKPTAERLARLLAAGDGARVLALMQELGLLEPPRAEPAVDRDRIGIWVPDAAAGPGVYRREPHEPPVLWADVERIEAKRSAPRVVLLGESVARGYFYDPAFGPAIALESLLRAAKLDGAHVVDLARTDQSRIGLLELLSRSFALQPDAVVVFAGNNWSGLEALDSCEQGDVGNLLRSGGLLALRRFSEARLARLATELVDRVVEACSARSIPIVFVIPEYNLADWRSQRHEAPLLSERARWIELRDAAQEALERSDFGSAERLATEIRELDAGLSPVGFEIAARCAAERGDRDAERELRVRARDAESWRAAPTTPRCFEVVRRVLLEHGRARGARVVDLPELFRAWAPEELPGRRFFHDYCHLTFEGIRVAMAQTACELASVLGGREPSFVELARREHALEPLTIARAYLLGAVHNASWGQSDAVIRHHASEAVGHSPAIAEAAQCIAELAARPMLPIMTAAYGRLLACGHNSIARFFWEWSPGLHTSLIEAFTSVSEPFLPGSAQRSRQAREGSHAVDGRRVDLLEPAYWLFSHQQLDRRAPDGFLYRAYDRRSRFVLVCREPRALRLTLTHRVPHGAGGELRVTFGAAVVGTASSARPWTESRFEIAAHDVRPGLNEITVEWPLPEDGVDDALERCADQVERGELWPHAPLGEIAGFEAFDFELGF